MKQHETDVLEPAQERELPRKPYTTPVMKDFGSVAELTRDVFPGYLFGS